jgi:putative phosphoesterase
VIALISDVHGNFPALQAVIAEIEMSGCERIISLGDVAGYYCEINECIDLLRQKAVINVTGNHDYYIVNNQPCPRSRSANDCLDYQRRHITSQNLEWLKNSAQRMDSGAGSFVHGGWKDALDEYLTDVNEDYFKNEKASFFFSGHTHIQSLRLLGRICYCNPGSVGQPRDNNPKAAFALFDGKQAYLKRIDYDIDKIAMAMESCGFNSYFYEGLYTGTGIGMVKQT